MNTKTAKYLRKLANYNPRKSATTYQDATAFDLNGRAFKNKTTKEVAGGSPRSDYQALKKYFKTGEVLHLSAKLRPLVGEK